MASEYQKRLLKEQQSRASQGITMSNDPRKSSSKSSQPKRVVRTEVIGNVVTDYFSDGTSRTVETTGKVGSATPKEIAKLTPISKSTGTIQGKVYEGVTQTEILRNKLSPLTTARILPKQTAQRNTYIQSYSRLQSGTGTSKDLLNVISGGKGRVENILNKSPLAYQLANRNELERFKSEVAQQMSPQQKSFYNTLPQSDRGKYLIQIASRRQQPTQEQKVKPVMSKPKKLSKLSNVVSSKLENWANSINKRGFESEKRLARREADIVSRTLARDELVKQYIPTGFKTIGKGINALINLGEKTFTGTLGFGEALASAGEKAVFLLPALGQSISRGDIKRFGEEFVTTEQKKVLKDIYYDPRTYRDALIGAGVMMILGGIKSGKLTAKNVQKMPKTGKGYSKGTILKDVKGNIGYVSKTGIVKPIPKGFRTVTRALTRPTREFIFRNVRLFPKTSTAKVGTVFRNTKGELRVVTKGGKVIKPKAFERRLLVKDFKKGTRARVKATQKARTIAKAKAEAIKSSKLTPKTSKILKARGKEIKLKQIQKEINTFTKRFNVKDSRKAEFSKAYKKYRLNPTDKNANILKKISDRIEVDKGVRLIDSIIKRDLASSKLSSSKTQDLINKKISPRQFLKERGIKIKEVTEREMFEIQLESPTFYKKMLKEAKKTGKVTIPDGSTDGNTIWILKGQPKQKIPQILRHEAIHILKQDVRAIQSSNFPSIKRFAIEKRTDLLTALKIKLPSKIQISKARSDLIKSGLKKSSVKKVKNLLKKEKLTFSEKRFLKKEIKKQEVLNRKIQKSKSLKEKDLQISQQFQAKIKADSQAQAKGFKNYEEQFNFAKIQKAFNNGEKGSAIKMRKFTRQINSRLDALSKARVKRIELQNRNLILEARKLLRNGKIAIKTEAGKIKYKRPKYSKEDTERVLRAIVSNENKILDKKARAEAKEVIKRGLVKEEIDKISPRVNAEIRKLINKEMIQLLRLDKQIKIQKGLVKGKQPKTRTTTKAVRKQFRAKIKEETRLERIARKKQKRSLAGDSQSRKIIRKQIRSELNKFNRQVSNLEKFTSKSKLSREKIRLNKELMKELRELKLMSKGRTPKTRLSKAVKKDIKSKMEVRNIIDDITKSIQKSQFKSKIRAERLARKKQKRSFAGAKQSRKIIRKQIRKEIDLVNRIVKGNANVPDGYILEATPTGARLVPKIGKIRPSKRIQTASEIIKKTPLKKGEIVKVDKNGTIQILKTVQVKETTSQLASRTRVLRRNLQRLKQAVKIRSTPQKLQLVQKQRTVSKTRTIKKTIQKLKTPKLSRLSSIGAVLFVSQGVLNRSKKRLAFAQSRFQDLAPTQTQDLVNELKLDLRKVQNLQQDVSNLQDLGTDLTPLQAQGLKQDQRQAVKLKQDLQQVLKQISRPRKIAPKKIIPKLPIIPPIPKLTWNSKLPRGYSLLVNARYKKGNKIYIKRLKTTPNRATALMNRFIDNNPQASYDLVVVGAKKVKDIKKPSMQKFTIRKGSNPKVRRNVEKPKYRLDRPREKAISRIRRKENAIKNKNTKLRKKPSKNRASRKKRK